MDGQRLSSHQQADPHGRPDVPLSWRDRWARFRNHLVLSPRFRRLSQRYFPGRQIAGRQSRQLFDLCAGFVYSQVLAACIELQLFDYLKSDARSLTQIAQETTLSIPAVHRLLEAARSLKLVEERTAGAGGEARYGLSMLGAAVLADPGIGAMVRHHRLLYADMADPVALLREPSGASLGAYWRYAGNGEADALTPSEVADYSDLMGVTQTMVVDQIMEAFDFAPHRTLLDIGAGQGGFIKAMALRYPAIQFTVFDLPAVVARAEQRFADAGLSDRVDVVGGNFISGALPDGADIITLIRVLFDHNDQTVERLLAAAFAALPSGARILIAEPMARTPGADPVGDAYFGFYLWAMGGGAPRTAQQHRHFLRKAGFVAIKEAKTPNPLIARVLIAIKP